MEQRKLDDNASKTIPCAIDDDEKYEARNIARTVTPNIAKHSAALGILLRSKFSIGRKSGVLSWVRGTALGKLILFSILATCHHAAISSPIPFGDYDSMLVGWKINS